MVTSSFQVRAQTSAQFAAMGKLAWSAFECSSVASVSGNDKERERLFSIGYDSGKRFVQALQAGKISKADGLNIAPSGFLMLAHGPTIDFILGRVFESAQDNALKDVFATNGNLNSEKLQTTIANNRFHERNCALLGL